MARKPHKFHYIYKTTCNITNRYYIGMHSTSNLEDGYMGSGKRLRYSLNKYGIQNHTKEIIEFLDDRISLAKRESEIVNEQSIDDPMCMNLKLGGFGGFCNEHHQYKCSSAGGKANSLKIKNDNNHSLKFRKTCSDINTSTKRGFLKKPLDWTGRKHKEETKTKMRESSKGSGIGEKNSQYGTYWITNGSESIKIKKDENIPTGWCKGRSIKKL